MRGDRGLVKQDDPQSEPTIAGNKGKGWKWEESFFKELLSLSPRVYNLHLENTQGNTATAGSEIIAYTLTSKNQVLSETFPLNLPHLQSPAFPSIQDILPYLIHFPLFLFVSGPNWDQACLNNKVAEIKKTENERLNSSVAGLTETPLFAFLPYRNVRTVLSEKNPKHFKVVVNGEVNPTRDIIKNFQQFITYPLEEPIPRTPKERALKYQRQKNKDFVPITTSPVVTLLPLP